MASTAWHARIAGLRRVAFDTNALIYLFEDREPQVDLVAAVLGRVEGGHALGIVSTIVEMELLVRPLREQDFAFVVGLELFLRNERNWVVRNVDREVARSAAAIRANTGMKAPDALIAATAVLEGCDAIIGNDRDFARLSDVPYLVLDDYAV